MATAPRAKGRRGRSPATPADLKPEPATTMATLKLDGTLDLGAATTLKAALLERRGAHLQIDTSEVVHLGGQCAQMLAAANAAWAADGVTLAFPAPSEAFEQGARLLGLHSILLSEGSRT